MTIYIVEEIDTETKITVNYIPYRTAEKAKKFIENLWCEEAGPDVDYERGLYGWLVIPAKKRKYRISEKEMGR